MKGARHRLALLATLLLASCGADPPTGPDNPPVDARPETTRLVEARQAGQVSPDGHNIQASSTSVGHVDWIAPPHFYRQSRLIVLYVGSDRGIMTLLGGFLGPQFAGTPPG